MTTALHYYLAQYVRDPIRRETENIGVIAVRGEETAARFVGENDTLEIDGRRLKQFVSPTAYREWVRYWRGQTGEGALGLCERLAHSQSENYRIIEGGDLTGLGVDSVEKGVDYIFSMLVSEGGLLAARTRAGEVEEADETTTSVNLQQSVNSAFTAENILAHGIDDSLPLVHHPIRSKVQIRGTFAEPHLLPFAQTNGLFWAMGTVDYTAFSKERAKLETGLIVAIIEDLRKAKPDATKGICIVKHTPRDLEYESVRYALSLAISEFDQVVNWLDDAERETFLGERREIALSPN